MDKQLVFNTRSVQGFSPRGSETAFLSRMLIDGHSVGSSRIVMNMFALRPSRSTGAGSHPAPFDEIYYVLRGAGMLYLHDTHEPHHLEPDTVAFIPAGTTHYLHNTGEVDLELITIMPGPLAKGANTLYDERQETWGTTFKFAG